MTKHNKANERIKRKYFIYLKEARCYSEATIDAAAKALSRFEEYVGYKDFKKFRSEQAIGFKKRLAGERAVRSGKPLSKATMLSTLTQLKRFFQWLAWEPGYKSRLQMSDADFFNMSRKDGRVAKTRRSQRAPTLEQIKHVLQVMPKGNELARRNGRWLPSPC